MGLCLVLIIPISDSFTGYLYGKKRAVLSSIFSLLEPFSRIILLLIFLKWIKTETIFEKDIYNIYIFSSFVSLFFLIYFLSRIVKPSFLKNIFKIPKLNIKTYTYSINFGVPALTRTLAQWLPLIIISWLTSPEVVGIYFIYSKFVMLISAIPQKVIEAILVPMIYEANNDFIKVLNRYRNLIVIIILCALVFILPFLFYFFDRKIFPNYQEILSIKIAIYIVSSSILIKLLNYIIEFRYIAKNQLQLLTKIKTNSLILSIFCVSLIAIIHQNIFIINSSNTAALCIIIFEIVSILFSSRYLYKINNLISN